MKLTTFITIFLVNYNGFTILSEAVSIGGLEVYEGNNKENFSQNNIIMQLETLKMCSQEVPIRLENITFSTKNNIFSANGSLVVTQKVIGPIAIELTSRRCDLKQSFCNNFPILTVSDYCVHLKTKYYGPNFISRIKPKFNCPLEAVSFLERTFKLIIKIILFKGEYSLNNLQIDARPMINLMPLPEGYFYSTYKFVKTDAKSKRTILSCVHINAKIVTEKVKRQK